ncbi:MAG: hypothetical protein HOQ16_13785 [Gemmatimonadaceae bacterium]|nr:hypothetical protein [Gemmatimonadaceae bacterium]
MTGGTAAPLRGLDWWVRPRVVLPIVGAFVVLVALLTPQPELGRMGDPRLSSHLAGGLGARALAETAERFGFDVVRRDSVGAPSPSDARGTAIHAVLAPVLPMTGEEAHRYLDAVRAGDGLLLVFDGRNALSDSLGLWRTRGGILYRMPDDSTDCHRRDFMPPLWPDGKVHLYGLRWVRGAPRDRIVLAALQGQGRDTVPDEAAAGFALGRGRVVAIPDPDFLRNDVLRRCEWGADVLAMRMLEWLRAGGDRPRTALVFDEYHQGFGRAPSALGTSAHFLVAHPIGRALLMVALAGLILLAAAAPRPLPPVDPARIERRDPLEQVDALAHAYEQVGATRTITLRLWRGLRARVDGASPLARGRSDEAVLAAIEAADPAVRDDVALVRRALRESVTTRELSDVGAALRRLEASLTTTSV